jgi:alkylation response protein AidB-like acyl-CoA dehydrogenase
MSSARGLEIISPTIGLSEARIEYYNIARSFADAELRPYAAKWDQECTFPLDKFKMLGEMGFGGWLVSEDVGGTNLKRADVMPIIEALATGCVSTTALLTIQNANSLVIDKFGTEEQRLRWLPKLLVMDLLVSFCLTEPGKHARCSQPSIPMLGCELPSGSGSDAGSLVTKAVYDANTDEYVISGTKVFISGAGEFLSYPISKWAHRYIVSTSLTGQSDLYVVTCRTGESITCIVVEKGTPGMSFGANEKKMGWNCQPTRQVNFEECRVPAKNRLATRFRCIARP